MRRNKKKKLSYIIVLVLMCLGIGYAYLTTTLSINGTTDIDSNTWDVHFGNLEVINGSVSGNQVTQAATISNQTTVSFHVNLKQPGDGYGFTIDAINAGTIDAIIDNVDLSVTGTGSSNYSDYLMISTYVTGQEASSTMGIPEVGDVLAAGRYEKYAIAVFFRNDIDPEDLPSEAKTLTVTFSVTYVQATQGHYVYTLDNYSSEFGRSIEIINTYNNIEDLSEESNYNDMFVKIYNIENRIGSASIGFKYNNNIYYIEDEPLSNRLNTINSIFGNGYCNISETGNYTCIKDGYTIYLGRGSSSIHINLGGDSEYYCSVNTGNKYSDLGCYLM